MTAYHASRYSGTYSSINMNMYSFSFTNVSLFSNLICKGIQSSQLHLLSNIFHNHSGVSISVIVVLRFVNILNQDIFSCLWLEVCTQSSSALLLPKSFDSSPFHVYHVILSWKPPVYFLLWSASIFFPNLVFTASSLLAAQILLHTNESVLYTDLIG